MKGGLQRLQGAWDKILGVILWRLAPEGCTVSRADLRELPVERVLVCTESESGEELALFFASVEAAREIREVRGADVSAIESMYSKLAAVLLWKFAKDGIVVTQHDLRTLPADRMLLVHGHADDLEIRFAPLAEARAIARQERDSEGRIILPGLEPR